MGGEPGDGGEASGIAASMTEEALVSRRDVQGVDVARRNASIEEGEGVGCHQIASPGVPRRRNEHVSGWSVGHEVTELGAQRLGDVSTDLVGRRIHGRTDTDDDAGRISAEPDHRVEGRSGDACNGPPPSGVHAAQHPGDGVDEDERHAVGDEDHEGHVGGAGHQGVGGGDGVGGVTRAPTDVAAPHHGDVSPVYLVGDDQQIEGGADVCCGPAPVLHDGVGFVTDVECKVERGVGAGGHAPDAGRDRGLDGSGCVESRPPQDGQGRRRIRVGDSRSVDGFAQGHRERVPPALQRPGGTVDEGPFAIIVAP